MLWWIDSCACLAVKALGALVCALPLPAALWLGRRVGDLMLWIKPKRARVAYVNLAWAFGARYTPEERRRIVREAYHTLGQTGIEMLRLPRIDAAYVERYVTVHGKEHLDAAMARGQGIVFLTGHFGNWELSSIVGALKGYPMVALAREQKLPRLYRMLVRLREAKGCRVIGKGMALRAMVRELRANRIVGIVGDQGAKTQGVRVTFFGRDALSPVGPVELALRTGATILPVFIRRMRGGHHAIEIQPPLEVAPHAGESTDATVRRGLQMFIERLEGQIREAPGQWLWMHKRWKSTTRRHALVLSDGKAGHLRQSLTVIEALQADRGAALTHDVIDVGYRAPWHRWLVTAAAWWPWALPERWLARMLTTRQALLDTPCDYVISCGASLAPVNAWLARTHDAKALVVMRPSAVPLAHFAKAFIPAHDRPVRRPNIVVTDGALSAITPERLSSARQALLMRHGLASTARRIGVLLGGDTADVQLTARATAQLLDALEPVCRESGAELLVTTSRRTSADVEELCWARLHQQPHCPLLVIANRANPAGTVEGILGDAQVVVVSGESSSMIAEAVASGRPVVVLVPEPKPMQSLDRKRRVLLEALAASGRVTVVSPEHAGAAVRALMGQASPAGSSTWDVVCRAVQGL